MVSCWKRLLGVFRGSRAKSHPKRGEDQDGEPDPNGICHPITELRVSVDQAPLSDLDHAASDEQPEGDRQHPILQTSPFTPWAPNHGKQDRERVDEIGGGVEVLVRAVARRRRTQRVPERETRRDERDQPDPGIDERRLPPRRDPVSPELDGDHVPSLGLAHPGPVSWIAGSPWTRLAVRQVSRQVSGGDAGTELRVGASMNR